MRVTMLRCDYEWRPAVDGETRDEWRLPFSTQPA
jgi:hypothetical protein